MPRSKGDKDETDVKTVHSVIKESSVGLLRVLVVLIIFVVGVVIGLASSSHIDRYFSFQGDSFLSTSTYVNNCNIAVNCEKEDCMTMESFIRPKHLIHSMSDEDLFWRASMVPEKEFPYKRVPKVAFMFLTRGPLPLLPLWEKFFQRKDEKLYSIYVHTQPAYKLNVTNTSVFYGRQIPSQKVEWGSVSLADAERRLLANALLDFSNERFILLSERCIPVYNFQTVYKYLTESLHSFVEVYDDPSRYGRGRYNRRMQPDIQLSNWRKGSQWFELNRELAIPIVSDTKFYILFKKYCRPSCYPDEHYIPTYLNLFYGALSANRTVTYVDWSQGGPHPATFTAVDITETFIQSIRNNATECAYNSEKTNVCYLFARKFSPDALQPLLNLSSKVMKF